MFFTGSFVTSIGPKGGRDFKHAIDDAETVKTMFAGSPIRYVSHSLSGCLAVAAAAVHGGRAKTFNGAGVNPTTVANHNTTLAGINQRVNAIHSLFIRHGRDALLNGLDQV